MSVSSAMTAYDVGAKLTMTTNVLRVMGEVSAKFTQFQGQLDKANAGMKSMAVSAAALHRSLGTLMGGRSGSDGMARQAAAMQRAATAQESAAAKTAAVQARAAEVGTRADQAHLGSQLRMSEIAAQTAAVQERSAIRVAEMQERGALRTAEIQQRAAVAAQAAIVRQDAMQARAATRAATVSQRATLGQAAAANHMSARLPGGVGIGVGMGGMAALGIGGMALHGIERGMHENMEIGHLRQVLLADQRIAPEDADRAVSSARDITRSAPGTTIAGNLHAIQDITSITGDLHEALTMAPQLQRLSTLLATMAGKHGGNSDPAYAGTKFMEIMGLMTEEKRNAQTGQMEQVLNPALLAASMEKVAKISVATNGRVGPEQLLAFAKQARVGGMMLSPEFLFEKLPAMIQVLGGDRTGTAIQSLSQVFTGNKITNKSYDAMVAAGLASPEGHTMVRDPRTGKMKDKVDAPHGIYDYGLLQSDPLEWVRKSRDRMSAKGITGEKEQLAAFQGMFQRSTIAGFMADLLKDLPVIDKEQARIKAMNPNAIDQFAQNDPTAKMTQLSSAWTNLMTTLTGPMLEPAIKAIESMTAGMNAVSDWAKGNPEAQVLLKQVAAALSELGKVTGAVATEVAQAVVTVSGVLGKIGSFLGMSPEGADAKPGGGSTLPLGSRVGNELSRMLIGPSLLKPGEEPPAPGAGMSKEAIEGVLASLMPGGRPSAAATPADVPSRPIQLQGNVNLDGKAVGSIVANGMTAGANRPPVGTMSNVTVRSGTASPGVTPAN